MTPTANHITLAIADLYDESGVAQPSAAHPVVPLGELIGGYNVTSVELPGLSSASAMAYLRERGAIVAVPDGVGTDRLAGFLYATRHHANIFVEQDDRLTRRRFSAAHELGHLLLHVRPFFARSDGAGADLVPVMEVLPRGDHDDETIDSSGAHLSLPGVADGVATGDETSRDARLVLEREADSFAGALLMPEEVIRALVAQYGAIFRAVDLAWRLASDLLVSPAAMRRRLLDLGVITPHARGLN